MAESQRVQALTPRSVLHREHAPPSERPGRLEGPPLPLAELRRLRLPRLSAADLLDWSRRPGPSQVCVIDVRPADEYPLAVAERREGSGSLCLWAVGIGRCDKSDRKVN